MVILHGRRDVNRHSKLRMNKGLEKKSPTSAEGNNGSSQDIIIETHQRETSNKRQSSDLPESDIQIVRKSRGKQRKDICCTTRDLR